MRFLFLYMLFSNYCIAQKVKSIQEYSASNGIVYKIGDTVTLKRGTDFNGNFKYLYQNGYGSLVSKGAGGGLTKGYGGYKFEISDIKERYLKGANKTFLIIYIRNTYTVVDLEQAIRDCEVSPCLTDVLKK